MIITLIGLVFFTKGLYGCAPCKFDNCFVGCILCEKGHYCPGSGGEAILCPQGKYGNAIGKTTLNTGCPYTTSNCPKGHYCPSNTHGEALPCPPGKYGNVNGKTTESSACTTLCPSGRYGNIPGQTSQNNACPSICSFNSLLSHLQHPWYGKSSKKTILQWRLVKLSVFFNVHQRYI
mgnify:CR=1 FL=1